MKKPALLAASLLLCQPLLAGTLDPAWDDMAHLNNTGAIQLFKQLPDSREAQLGEAIALLDQEPKTQAGLDRAAHLMDAVRQGGADDDLGIAALYFQARLAQVHALNPDLDQAIKLYSELIHAHPGHPLAQMAVIKLAILRIYLKPEIQDKAARLDQVAAMGATLTDPSAIRDFELLIGDAYTKLDVSREKSLDHLLRAYQTGGITGNAVPDILVRIGELARILDRKPMAIDFYQKFLKDYPHDSRVFTVHQRLEALL